MNNLLNNFLSARQDVVDKYNEAMFQITTEYAIKSGFLTGVMIKHKESPYTSIIEDICVMSPINPTAKYGPYICVPLIYCKSTHKSFHGVEYEYYYNIEDIEIASEEYLIINKSAEKKAEKKKKFGWVYLMEDLSNGYYKIGWSKNAEYRERTLQSEKPTICLLKKVWADFSVEKKVHEFYSAKRIRGEWFSLTKDELKDFVNIVESIKTK